MRACLLVMLAADLGVLTYMIWPPIACVCSNGLSGVKVYEARGGVDFDAMIQYCLAEMIV
jgi:phosphotransferase system  glucose/maltose/N-acetylglucosamine-specific IIC component